MHPTYTNIVLSVFVNISPLNVGQHTAARAEIIKNTMNKMMTKLSDLSVM